MDQKTSGLYEKMGKIRTAVRLSAPIVRLKPPGARPEISELRGTLACG